MSNSPRFRVERSDGRVLLVPEFWPSDLEESQRRRYDALVHLHKQRDGALSIPQSDLHALAPEPESVVSLDDVWAARERRVRRAYDGFVFPDHGMQGVRDLIAVDLLE